MSACGVGELLAAHVTNPKLPSYAKAFGLSRYKDVSIKENERVETIAGSFSFFSADSVSTP